jgi:hypothetical protein
MMIARKRKLLWLRLLWLYIIGASLSACVASSYSFAKVTPLTSTSMVIFASMTRNYSGAHGVLNIYVEAGATLTPASGQKDAGLTATLWLMIEGRPETYTSFRVKSGQTVVFEDYEIKVLRIEEDGQGFQYVEVDVTEPK